MSDEFRLWLLVLLLALVACGRLPFGDGAADDDGEGAESVYVPVVLDLAMQGSPPLLDPQKAQRQNSLDLIENLYVGLTNYNVATNTIEPELARSWEVSSDGRLWTFRLRDDISWILPTEQTRPDGLTAVAAVRPVVADDVVYAVQRACDSRTETPDAFILFIITGCEAVYSLPAPTPEDLTAVGIRALDEQTVEVSLTKPAAHFLTITSMPVFKPVPVELVEEFGSDPGVNGQDPTWYTVEETMYSGPFVPVLAKSSSDRIVLHRNHKWPLPRRGNVDVINIFFLDDEMDIYQSWADNDLDVSPLPASEREDVLERVPFKVTLVPQQTIFYFGFNFDSGVFREVEIRQAFNAALDRDIMVEELYGERALGMRHLTPPGVVGTLPVDEVGVGYRPDYARQKIADSNFRACRLMPEMTFLVSSADLSLQLAELARDMWVDELGCDEKQFIFEQVGFGTLLSDTQRDGGAERPDIWELGWATYYPDAHNWVGDLLHCNDSANRQNRSCSEVDQLIQQADLTLDPVARADLYRQIENLFFGENGSYPIIPLYLPSDYVLVQTWLQYQPAIFGGEQYDTYLLNPDLKRLERSR